MDAKRWGEQHFTYHDSHRPYIYLRVPVHAHYYFRCSVNPGHNIASVLLPWLSQATSAKVANHQRSRGNWHGVGEVDGSIRQNFAWRRVLEFCSLHFYKRSGIMNTKKDIIWRYV